MSGESELSDDATTPGRPGPEGVEPLAGTITLFFHQLQSGNEAAAAGLWQAYFPRLVGLARRTLSGLPQRASDAEDAAQSAFISFWRRVRQGGVASDLDRLDLWRLLAVMTVRKARKQAGREFAAKRGGGRVVHETALGGVGAAGNSTPRLEELVAALPPQELDLSAEEMLQSLPAELRQFAVLRLLGHSTQEIAAQFQCTQRKVQRKLKLIEARWRD